VPVSLVAQVSLTGHPSRFTPHVSRFTPHVSRFTPHVSRLTPHVSRLTPDVFGGLVGGREAAIMPRPMRPTHTRWVILALLFLISIVTYIDRVNISVTARQIMPALGLTDRQMGEVFSAFVLGYALCQIPGGWLGDRWGARRVLTLAVIWWSVFTAMTAVAPVLPVTGLLGVLGSLILVRFLVGVGESAALPNFNRAIANWVGPHERGLAIGIAIGGLGIGSAVTPPVTAWIMVNFGWQSAFYAASLLGVMIAAIWFFYATDHPSQHPHVNAQEAAVIGDRASEREQAGAVPVPWAAFARTPTIWWLVLSYTCLGYVAYVYMSWFYLYLVNVRGFGVLRGALWASAPFLAISAFCPFGGWVTDRLAARFGVNHGRATVGALGMCLSGASIFTGAAASEPYVAILLLSLGAGLLYWTVGAFWASTVDLTKRHAGTLSGIMNTGANIGGTVSPTLTPWVAERFGWATALETAGAVAVVGGVLWCLIRPGNGLRTGKG
jgi:ACS family glucarate transporter-like MFS transporter